MGHSVDSSKTKVCSNITKERQLRSDLDCEQSLLSRKIHGEERQTSKHASVTVSGQTSEEKGKERLHWFIWWFGCYFDRLHQWYLRPDLNLTVWCLSLKFGGTEWSNIFNCTPRTEIMFYILIMNPEQEHYFLF